MTTTTKKAKSKATKGKVLNKGGNKKKSAPSHSQSTTGTSSGNMVEFRFRCSPELRDQINNRLKILHLERGDLMRNFMKEWLKQTDIYLSGDNALKASHKK
ncbi:MAG: hypothetical protein OXC40_06270 [Proteobacteria bacterium]|nr:hypothetical protein [Pseudomonadota bacterium]